MDQLLGGLFGGQDDDDDDRRQTRAKDFVNRYETGSPTEGYDADEAAQNYRSVADRLSPEEYEDAAAQAFGRLSPQERSQLGQMMQQQGGGRFPGVTGDDPRDLARATSRFRQQEPGGLASLFGMGGGGGGGDLLGATRGDRGGGGGGLGDLMSNPLAKAALGGIAAVALKKMMR